MPPARLVAVTMISSRNTLLGSCASELPDSVSPVKIADSVMACVSRLRISIVSSPLFSYLHELLAPVPARHPP